MHAPWCWRGGPYAGVATTMRRPSAIRRAVIFESGMAPPSERDPQIAESVRRGQREIKVGAHQTSQYRLLIT